jgi:hypothetical protein
MWIFSNALIVQLKVKELILRQLIIFVSNIRGHPYRTSVKICPFLTPLPPLSALVRICWPPSPRTSAFQNSIPFISIMIPTLLYTYFYQKLFKFYRTAITVKSHKENASVDKMRRVSKTRYHTASCVRKIWTLENITKETYIAPRDLGPMYNCWEHTN